MGKKSGKMIEVGQQKGVHVANMILGRTGGNWDWEPPTTRISASALCAEARRSDACSKMAKKTEGRFPMRIYL